jgi:hypothetical protein
MMWKVCRAAAVAFELPGTGEAVADVCVPVLDPTCVPQIASSAASSMLQTIADAFGMFVTELIKLVVTGWLRVPSPQVASNLDEALGGGGGVVAQLRGATSWMVAALAVGSLLVAAARIAWSRNGREAADLGRGLLQLVLLSGLGVPVVLLLTQVGDVYSDWIVDRATGGQFERRVTTLFGFGASGAVASGPVKSLGLIGIIFVGFLLAVTLVVQLLLMFGRTVGLVLLTGLLPVAAAGGMVGRATHTRDKYVAWLISFTLYKPVAATVYATGFWLIGEGTSITDILAGMMTFIIALVALPALMRLITPMVGSLADGAGAGAMAGAAMGASLATGAISVGGAMSHLRGAGTGSGGGAAGGGGDEGGGSGATRAASGALLAAGTAGAVAAAATQGAKQVGQAVDAPRQVAETAGGIAASGAVGGEQ